MKALIAVIALALAGCATGTFSKDAPPRSLITSPQAPSCVILCFVHNTQANTQEDIKSDGGGAITSTITETTQDASKDGVGGSTSDAKPADGKETRNIRPVIVPVLPPPTPERN
jgi:hypothetical protein